MKKLYKDMTWEERSKGWELKCKEARGQNAHLRKALEELEVESKWLDELLDILKCESIDDAKAKCRLVMSILKLTEALKGGA